MYEQSMSRATNPRTAAASHFVSLEHGQTAAVVDVTDADGSVEAAGDDAQTNTELHAEHGVGVHLQRNQAFNIETHSTYLCI